VLVATHQVTILRSLPQRGWAVLPRTMWRGICPLPFRCPPVLGGRRTSRTSRRLAAQPSLCDARHCRRSPPWAFDSLSTHNQVVQCPWLSRVERRCPARERRGSARTPPLPTGGGGLRARPPPLARTTSPAQGYRTPRALPVRRKRLSPKTSREDFLRAKTGGRGRARPRARASQGRRATLIMLLMLLPRFRMQVLPPLRSASHREP